MVGCLEGKDTTEPAPNTPDTSDGSLDCAGEILSATDDAYSTCFSETLTYGACETCGYWVDPSLSLIHI